MIRGSVRWASTLVIGAKASGSTLNSIAAAKQLNQPITLLTWGDSDDANISHSVAEHLSESLAEVIKGGDVSHVIASSDSVGRNVIPRLASKLEGSTYISDITSVIDSKTFTRPIYAGNAIATIKVKDDVKVICSTVRQTAFPAVESIGDDVTQTTLAAKSAASSSSWVSDQLSAGGERPQLQSASVVVSGGRALKDAATFDSVMNPLADKLGAALGASRAAVDAGYCSNDMQVGQTGKIVAPALYVAVGISGAIQHCAGMKDSKVIVAINKDPDAPIFSISDYGLVADLYSAVPELVKKI